MRHAVVVKALFPCLALLGIIGGGCVYTPTCTPAPSNAMDGPVSAALLPDNMLYVINSNGDSRYCSSYISKVSLSSPGQPSYGGVIPLNYHGDISLVAGSYLSTTGLLWIADRDNNRVLIYDTAAGAITAAIPVGVNPVSITPIGTFDGDQLMLSCNLASNNVSIISSNQKKELYRIGLTNNGPGAAPLNAVVTPYPVSINGQPPDVYAYVTRGADNNVSVVSMNDHCELNPATPSYASAPVFNTTTAGNAATVSGVQTHNCLTQSELWTLSYTSSTDDFIVQGSVSGRMPSHARIGLPYTAYNGTVSFTVDEPPAPYTDGDNFTFYTYASSGLINVPNLPGTGVGTAVPVTRAIVMTPGAGRIFVSYTGMDSVVVIDPATDAVMGYIKVGKTPEGMLLSPDGSTLYVACYNDNKVYAIDTRTESVTGIVGVDGGPFAMALSPDGRYLYVIGYSSDRLDVIDLSDFSLAYTLQ